MLIIKGYLYRIRCDNGRLIYSTLASVKNGGITMLGMKNHKQFCTDIFQHDKGVVFNYNSGGEKGLCRHK